MVLEQVLHQIQEGVLEQILEEELEQVLDQVVEQLLEHLALLLPLYRARVLPSCCFIPSTRPAHPAPPLARLLGLADMLGISLPSLTARTAPSQAGSRPAGARPGYPLISQPGTPLLLDTKKSKILCWSCSKCLTDPV